MASRMKSSWMQVRMTSAHVVICGCGMDSAAAALAREHRGERVAEQRIDPLAFEPAVMRHPEGGVGHVLDQGRSHGSIRCCSQRANIGTGGGNRRWRRAGSAQGAEAHFFA